MTFLFHVYYVFKLLKFLSSGPSRSNPGQKCPGKNKTELDIFLDKTPYPRGDRTRTVWTARLTLDHSTNMTGDRQIIANRHYHTAGQRSVSNHCQPTLSLVSCRLRLQNFTKPKMKNRKINQNFIERERSTRICLP